jgi:hypothetical protein
MEKVRTSLEDYESELYTMTEQGYFIVAEDDGIYWVRK